MATATRRRVIDMDEVDRLIAPHTHNLELQCNFPVNQLVVTAMLAAGAQDTDAGMRKAAVEAANEAISAVEAAGYEHAEPPKIEIGGFRVPPTEAGRYIFDARLSLVLLGKWASP